MNGRHLLAIVAVLFFCASGCTVAWSGSISLKVDPGPLLQLQRPLPALPPEPSELIPATTYILDPESRTES